MNKHEYTAALLEQHFDTAFAAPDGIKKLRELILTLAMQGKLVPQDPNDPPASELLKEIEAEKKRLVKEGKVKAPKPLPPVTDEEKPYELPLGWEWVRLGEVGLVGSSSRVHQRDWRDEGVPFFRAREIVKLSNFGFVENDLFISEEQYTTLANDGLIPEANDLMITGVGTIGIPYIVKETDRFYFKDASVLIFKNFYRLFAPFLFIFFKSPFWIERIHDGSMGTTVHTLTIGRANEILVPLPPLPEQHHIVAKIDQLMARCDELEKLRTAQNEKRLTVHAAAIQQLLNISEPEQHQRAQTFLAEHFAEIYTVKENVTELRKAILQLAVMGKLVPQDPNDPPASELLKEIEAEKKRLVKEGKIKAPKPLPPVTDEEKPYALPLGWEWVRFFDSNTVKSELVSARDYPDANQIAPDSIEKDTGRLLFHRTVVESGANGPNNRFCEGQILYSKIRPSLNKVVVAPYDGLCSADMYPIICHVHTAFMLKVILSVSFLAQVKLAENRVKMPKLNLESLGQLLIPIPPLPEQHRIVAKIDQLMARCDELERLRVAVIRKQTELLDAVMAQV